MTWRGPEYAGEFPSLGPIIADWCEAYLRWQGAPWRFTDPQYRFLCRAYRLDETTAQLYYRRAAKIAPKGYGKSPTLGAVSVAEAAGPVRCDGWDADGEPVGVTVDRWGPCAPPYVQLAAVSEDATDNTYSVLLALIEDGSLEDVAPGIDTGLTRTFLPHNGGKIEPVTSSAGSREGQRITFAVFDETHLWTPSNGGVRLAATLRRNLAKMRGFSVETTNAPRPGEMSVAEGTIAAGKAKSPGILVEHRVPSFKVELDDDDSVMRAMVEVYDGAPWIDLDRLLADFRDPDTEQADAERYYLNKVTKPADSWIDAQDWTLGARPDEVVADGEMVTLGFDGAQYDDATALIGSRVSDGHIFTVGIWERPEGQDGIGWQVDADLVDAAVDAAFGKYNVLLMLADPWGDWRPNVGAWSAKWNDRAREFDTRHIVKVCRALNGLEADIRRHAVTHDGNPILARHMANARRRQRGDLYILGKDHKRSPRKIDGAVAATLAAAARVQAIEEGLDKKRRGGRVHSFE